MAQATVLVAAFGHETNTFASMVPKTDRAAFQQREEYFAEAVTEQLRDTNTAIGGIIEVAETEDIALVQTVAAMANPGYLVASEAYEYYTEHILRIARERRGEIDGVILALHGAMVPEGMDDGEGPLVAAVRETVGSAVPVVVTLDLHGNVTDRLIAASDAVVAYETYPHVDIADTGRVGMRLLCECMTGELNPTVAVERPPVLVSGPLQNTRSDPMATVMARARELETRPRIRNVNVLPGFYPADVPDTGFSVVVVADDDPRAATEAARNLAAFVWERRESFVADYPGPAAAVREARSFIKSRFETDDDEPRAGTDFGPVVLADVGDNPGGGSPADGTTVLRELIEQGVTNAGFALIRDTEAVSTCIDAGVGERVTVTLGGTTDDRFGAPLEDIDGYVKAITDGVFVSTGPMSTGVERHLGRTVLLQCGHDDSIAVILTENRVQPMDAELWRHVGIAPERFGVIAVKSTNHYRADYEPLASRVVPVDTPGLFPADPRRFEYDRIRRPQFPLDEMAADSYPDWN